MEDNEKIYGTKQYRDDSLDSYFDWNFVGILALGIFLFFTHFMIFFQP
jgi:hypothetical protein